MIRPAFAVACDVIDCDAAWPPVGYQATNRREIRQGAKRDGWARDGGYDYCPTHKAYAREDEQEAVELIRRLAGAGIPDGKIASRLGRSRDYVRQLRIANGIKGQRPGRPSSGFYRPTAVAS